MEIGAQLFTVNAFCKDLDGFAESLKRIADIGYKNVQVSGTCDFDPQWLNEQLRSNGLKCVLTHTKAPELIGDAKKVAENHNVFDCDYVGLGMFNFKPEEREENYKKFIDTYSSVANILAENGKYFMYHNHANEFIKIGGKTILDKMAEDIPEDKMGFTLDTFWIQAGGADPAAYIEKFSGRVPCIHLKDFAYEGDKIMAVVGEGNINFDRIFEKAESAGTKYMLVEQDNCNGENPFDCLKRSYEYLKSCGF